MLRVVAEVKDDRCNNRRDNKHSDAFSERGPGGRFHIYCRSGVYFLREEKGRKGAILARDIMGTAVVTATPEMSALGLTGAGPRRPPFVRSRQETQR